MTKILYALLAAFAACMVPMKFGTDPASWSAAHVAFAIVMMAVTMTALIGMIISEFSKGKNIHKIHRSSR